MVIKTGSSKYTAQRHRVVTPGWAAFDRLQRQKQGTECVPDCDPYPTITSKNNMQSQCATACSQQIKTFASVIRGKNTTGTGGFHNDRGDINDYHAARGNSDCNLETLKNLYEWANEGLIQDVLAAVNNDKEKASSVLIAMSTSENTVYGEDFADSFDVANDCLEGNIANHSGDSKLLANHSGDSKLLACQESVTTTWESSSLRHPFSAPIEPEWEEEDVYLIHRRDAIKMKRTASKHSRAASNAFSRGDHVSAHQLSLKARGERATAEMLNCKAAMEIYRLRNGNDNIWKLDLHGLHASEAVNILKEHLHKLESMQNMTSVSAIKQKESVRLRQMVLQVITGTGKHSHGQAALPAVVRGFLIENGYSFDDARSGVLAVVPKSRFK